MASIDLSICIVNWNARNFLIDCLQSIYKSRPSLKFEIILVDNASSDNSIPLVKKKYPTIMTISSETNDGFAAGNNVAIKHSSGKFVLLLNPDTLVSPGSLDLIVKFMDSNRQIGVCGGKLFHPETGCIEASARSFPTLIPLIWHLFYLDRLFPFSPFFNKYTMNHLSSSKVREVDWVTGACLLVRREVIDQVDGLDENFFMYCEDLEWCYRIKRAGWKVFYYPSVEIAHYRGQSSKLRKNHRSDSLSVWGAQRYTSSILYFYAKHYGKRRTFLLRIIIVISSLFKAGLWLFGGCLLHSWTVLWRRAWSYLSTIPIALGQKHFK